MTLPTDSAPPAATASPTTANGNTAQVSAAIRDLIVHLHQGNGRQADLLMTELSKTLECLRQAAGPNDGERLQVTTAAIGEARLLLGEKDMWGAASAAREAAKEWRKNPVSE